MKYAITFGLWQTIIKRQSFFNFKNLSIQLRPHIQHKKHLILINIKWTKPDKDELVECKQKIDKK